MVGFLGLIFGPAGTPGSATGAAAAGAAAAGAGDAAAGVAGVGVSGVASVIRFAPRNSLPQYSLKSCRDGILLRVLRASSSPLPRGAARWAGTATPRRRCQPRPARQSNRTARISRCAAGGPHQYILLEPFRAVQGGNGCGPSRWRLGRRVALR